MPGGGGTDAGGGEGGTVGALDVREFLCFASYLIL